MIPRQAPPCLLGLSQVEEMLIARACPIMCVYRKHGGQRGYRGHVLNLPQDIQQFLTVYRQMYLIACIANTSCW